MSRLHFKAATALLSLVMATAPSLASAGSGTVTLIQTGDIHGHLLPRPNLRSDAVRPQHGRRRGAHVHGHQGRCAKTRPSASKSRRKKCTDYSLLLNTGDTVQGSGEALFSRGQAMIDVLNNFGFVAHAPGNWDFLYGPARFEETFKGTATTPPLANWNAMASNLYYTNQFDDAAVCGVTATDPATGTVRPRKRVLPTYMHQTSRQREGRHPGHDHGARHCRGRHQRHPELHVHRRQDRSALLRRQAAQRRKGRCGGDDLRDWKCPVTSRSPKHSPPPRT